VGKILNDGAALALSVTFPAYFAHKGKLYKVDGKARKAVARVGEQGSRDSPLPGFLGQIPLPRAVNECLWTLRSIPMQKYAFVTYIKGVLDVNGPVTLLNAAAGVGSLAAISYNHFIDKPWWLTNLQGFAVSYTALQVMSPTTFATGSLILTGLFFYDIWAVFFTPLMVTVAKNLDQPIKLLFPRPDAPGAEGKPPVKSYSMLGLGDIVLPGLMIGLALRFDLHMYYLKKQQIATAKSGEDSKNGGDVVKADYHNVTGLASLDSRSGEVFAAQAAGHSIFPQTLLCRISRGLCCWDDRDSACDEYLAACAARTALPCPGCTSEHLEHSTGQRRSEANVELRRRSRRRRSR
jgi:minor histocompatibility antigen H13